MGNEKSQFSLFSFQSHPNVVLSHEVFEKSNAWAITPILIDILNKLIKPQTKWFVLCEANSMVNMEKLLEKLETEDETQVWVRETKIKCQISITERVSNSLNFQL